MKLRHNHLLAASILLLLLLCFFSVNAPMRFERQRQEREAVVKRRLLIIRNAQETYRLRHGNYAPTFQELTSEGLLADSLTLVPFSENEPFHLASTLLPGKSNEGLPLMECGAEYNQYLRGLSSDAIGELTRQAENAGRYPGLKVGDLTTPNGNAGNWE